MLTRRQLLQRGAIGGAGLVVTTDIYGHWERAERKYIRAAKMEDAFPV